MNEPSPSTSDTDVLPESLAISVENVSASYQVRKEVRLTTSFRDGFSNLLQGPNSTRLVPALRGVSVSVPKFGLITICVLPKELCVRFA